MDDIRHTKNVAVQTYNTQEEFFGMFLKDLAFNGKAFNVLEGKVFLKNNVNIILNST